MNNITNQLAAALRACVAREGDYLALADAALAEYDSLRAPASHVQAAAASTEDGGIDWYERREELRAGQIFSTCTGGVVQLDRRVPGDGSKWYVLDWHEGWAHYDSTIEPGDLVELQDPEDYVPERR